MSSQHALQSLTGVERTLRTLVLADNPLSETEDYRLIVISRLPLLERLDKGHVSPVEQTEAQERIRVQIFSTEVAITYVRFHSSVMHCTYMNVIDDELSSYK